MSQAKSDVIVEESRALPIVHFGVGLKSGAIGDPIEKAGLSRLAARLMRRTAGGRSSEVIDAELDRIGASIGVDVHPSGVLLQGTVIARSLPRLLELVFDTLAQPGFDEGEFGKLVRESQAELIDERDDDRSLAQYWFRREIFPTHATSVPVSGTEKSLGELTLGDLRAWHKTRFRREDLVFSFAGDLQTADALAFAERLKECAESGSHTTPIDREPSIPQGRRLVIVDKPERTQTQLLIGALGTHPSDDDHTALLVANTVFGGTFTARLTHEVRAKRGWSYGAYSSLPYDRTRRAFSMWTFPAATDAAACLRLELELLTTWREHGITKEELERAQNYLIRSNAFTTDTAGKRAGLVLDEAIHELPPNYHRGLVERVRAVTLDEANHAVQRRISDRNLLVLAVATAEDSQKDLEGAIDELSEVKVIPYDRGD